MERDDIPSPENLEVYVRAADLTHLAGKIIHLAKKHGLYTEPPQGDLFEILESITIGVVNDERQELLELGNLIMEFNHQRDQLPPNKLRFTVSVGTDGITIIDFTM